MATRFYANFFQSPYTPASLQGSWSQTLAAGNYKCMDPYKWGSLNQLLSAAETSATNPFKLPIACLVSRRLAAGQTIAGTLNLCLGVRESATTANMFWRVHAYVVSVDTGVTLGTLLNQYTESAGGGATEWSTTNTGRSLQSAQAVTSVGPMPDDRHVIVVELGASCENASATSFTGSIRCGSRDVNGPQHADLTAGSTSTSTLAGWVEFSATIALASDVIQNINEDFAVDMGSLPSTPIVQSVVDAGVAYPVWYSLTSPTAGMVRVWPKSDGFPTVGTTPNLYTGPAASIARIPGIDSSAFGNTFGRPIQTYVEASQEYFYEFFPTGSLTLTITASDLFEPSSMVAAPMLIPDDVDGLPAALLDSVTGEILEFIQPFPAGENCFAVADYLLTEDISGASANVRYAWDGSTLTLQPTTYTYWGGFRGEITGNTADAFYFIDIAGSITKINAADGTVLDTWTPANSPDGSNVAVSPDESIFYYGYSSGGTYRIARHDLVNDVGLTDLVDLGALASFTPRGSPLLALSDGTLVVCGPTGGATCEVRTYAPDGTLLLTIDLAATEDLVLSMATDNQVFHSLNNPTTFMLWLKVHDPALTDQIAFHRFYEVTAATGALSSPVDVPMTETGIYFGSLAGLTDASDVPWGVSESCPAVMLVGIAADDDYPDITIAPGTPGPYVWVHVPVRSS